MYAYFCVARCWTCWSKVIKSRVSWQEKVVHNRLLSNEWTPVCHLGQCK